MGILCSLLLSPVKLNIEVHLCSSKLLCRYEDFVVKARQVLQIEY